MYGPGQDSQTVYTRISYEYYRNIERMTIVRVNFLILLRVSPWMFLVCQTWTFARHLGFLVTYGNWWKEELKTRVGEKVRWSFVLSHYNDIKIRLVPVGPRPTLLRLYNFLCTSALLTSTCWPVSHRRGFLFLFFSSFPFDLYPTTSSTRSHFSFLQLSLTSLVLQRDLSDSYSSLLLPHPSTSFSPVSVDSSGLWVPFRTPSVRPFISVLLYANLYSWTQVFLFYLSPVYFSSSVLLFPSRRGTRKVSGSTGYQVYSLVNNYF